MAELELAGEWITSLSAWVDSLSLFTSLTCLICGSLIIAIVEWSRPSTTLLLKMGKTSPMTRLKPFYLVLCVIWGMCALSQLCQGNWWPTVFYFLATLFGCVAFARVIPHVLEGKNG